MFYHIICPVALLTLILVAGCQEDAGASSETSGREDMSSLPDVSLDSAPDPDASEDCMTTPEACAYTTRDLAVRTIDMGTFTDPFTSRTLPVLVRAPEAPGTYPVVIWGHGGSLNNMGHTLGKEWSTFIASHGYIVVHLAHVEFSGMEAVTMCMLSGLPDEETCRAHENEVYSVTRAHDLRALLVRLPDLSSKLNTTHELTVDLTRVALAGWSAGSQGTATLSGATRLLALDTIFSLAPPEMPSPRALVMLSPSGPGEGQFYATAETSSWQTIAVPTLMATGTNDVKPTSPQHNGALRREAFDYLPKDGKRYLLYSNLPMGVGGHGTYNLGDYPSDDARLQTLSIALRSVMLAFLDAHLKDDVAALQFLEGPKPSSISTESMWLRK